MEIAPIQPIRSGSFKSPMRTEPVLGAHLAVQNEDHPGGEDSFGKRRSPADNPADDVLLEDEDAQETEAGSTPHRGEKVNCFA